MVNVQPRFNFSDEIIILNLQAHQIWFISSCQRSFSSWLSGTNSLFIPVTLFSSFKSSLKTWSSLQYHLLDIRLCVLSAHRYTQKDRRVTETDRPATDRKTDESETERPATGRETDESQRQRRQRQAAVRNKTQADIQSQTAKTQTVKTQTAKTTDSGDADSSDTDSGDTDRGDADSGDTDSRDRENTAKTQTAETKDSGDTTKTQTQTHTYTAETRTQWTHTHTHTRTHAHTNTRTHTAETHETDNYGRCYTLTNCCTMVGTLTSSESMVL